MNRHLDELIALQWIRLSIKYDQTGQSCCSQGETLVAVIQGSTDSGTSWYLPVRIDRGILNH